MKITRRLVTAAALAAVAAGCEVSGPTEPAATPVAPRLDGGYGMGSGSVVGDPIGGPGMTTQHSGPAVTDSTGRGGYGMGSGS